MTPDVASYILSGPSRAGIGRPFDGVSTRLLFLYVVTANAVLALALARPLARLLPMPYRERHAFWLFAMIIAAIPGLGLPIALFVAAGITRFTSHAAAPEPQTLGLPAFGAEMRGRQRHMGAGGAWAILRSRDAGVARGVRALLALDPHLSRQTSPLVRSALRHPEEDLRLLAYGLLDRREGDLSQAISEALTQRQSPEAKDDKGLLEKRLAFLYWELLYQDLSRDHLRQHAIRRAQTHALAALKRRPNDATLHVLMGRIAMLEGHYLAARTHCERALDLNAAPGQVLPYLAETRFRLGDFAALKSLARDYPSLRDVPTIGPVVRFWSATP